MEQRACLVKTEDTTMLTKEDFFGWEKASRDTIDVKRCYIDIAGDLVAGILLSQIIYWFLPGKTTTKLHIEHDGIMWLAKGRADWWSECRITAKQFDRAAALLKSKGLIEMKLYRFRGSPTVHLALCLGALVEGVKSILTKGENPILPDGEIQIDERVKSLHTETTAKTTNREKKAYGEFGNVLLTEDEYRKLEERFNSQLSAMIENLSGGIESKGYKYKSHYATI